VATFYPYLPDLAIAQVMFPAGLTMALLASLALSRGSGGRRLRAAAAAVTAAGLVVAGTAVALAGTGKLDTHGMIAIPALHDAASDRPIRFTPACSHTAIPVCLNPAYASYLPVAVTALGPVLREIAGLPGAPVRISQAAATYGQGTGNSLSIGLAGPAMNGRPPVLRLLLPSQLPGPAMTTSELAAQIRSTAGPEIVSSIVGASRSPSPAQQAVAAALVRAPGLLRPGSHPRSTPSASRERDPLSPLASGLAPGSPAYAAAQRFAALAPSARHAWLVRHLTALRAGRITLAQLP
jgi:hypothetical protein